MIKAGIRVPPGFAVTTNSYDLIITETGIKDRIYDALLGLDPSDMTALNAVAEEVQNMIKGVSISNSIRDAIREAYITLCESCGVENLPVAVRSSATAEDLPTASFAGQQETFLWIQGVDKVIESVQKCWASLFTPRAVSYRIKNDFPHEKVLISVGIQKMVNARAAGVMFTLNPVNGDRSRCVIEGSWGLGETVVSGSVNPDKFVIDKVVLEFSEKTISEKHIECVFDPEKGEVVNADVDPEIQGQCCLADQEVVELVKVGKRIETHYGQPMDIEWAIDKDLDFPEGLFIVQARPETVWNQREVKPTLGKRTGYQLLMQRAMTRIKIPNG
ncbi:MAG: phenylphosphate synthase subunit beta [Proteobacteria bacterium]|nr:phenylphosphate synthase subunit beta [Pseudomonadota bacterium]MBU1740749.1 phenylphosphate synthase subunit beta [Pseudomonadota bacterium]